MRVPLMMAVLLFSSCSRQLWYAPMAPDTTTSTSLLPALPAGGKYKFTGPVTFTLATAPGATATSTSTDNRKAGQKGGVAATAPDAVATATTKKGGMPWWVFGLFVAAGIVLGIWVIRKLPFV